MHQENVCQVAIQSMKSGSNCCQAVIIAACQEWNLPIPEELLAAGSLCGEGMQSGCTCGALTGMVMVSGYRSRSKPISQDLKLAARLHDAFKEAFGATCCRVIKKKRSLLEKMGSKACQELTGRAAALLILAWEELERDTEAAVVDYHTNPE